MKNIAIIIMNITERAGTERAISNLSNILSSQNNVLIISVNSINGNAAYPLADNIKINHLNINVENHNLFIKIINYIKFFKKTKKIVIDENIDFLFGTLNIFNCIISNIKLCKTIGCEHFNYQSAGKFHKILRKIFYKKLSSVVVLTNDDAKNYKFLNNVSVIPNSLSFTNNFYNPLTQKEIISIGRLTKQKGYDLLIDAAEIMYKKIPDWHISIYGDGEDRETLLKKINEKKLSSFISIQKPVTNVVEVYNKSSIYLSSSRWEGLPMVLIEAQESGLPVVSFDYCYGPNDIIKNNENGFICKCFDINEFAEKTILICNDQELRNKFSIKAKEYIKSFSTESVAIKWFALLNKIEEQK